MSIGDIKIVFSSEDGDFFSGEISKAVNYEEILEYLNRLKEKFWKEGFIEGIKSQSPHSPQCVCDKCVLIRNEVEKCQDNCYCRCHNLPEDLRKIHLCTCPREKENV